MPAKKPEKKFVSGRPLVFAPDPDDPKKQVQVGPQEVDLEGYEGSYTRIGEPEENPKYGLKIIEDDPYGHTHHLANQEFHWSGTKEDFKKHFEK